MRPFAANFRVFLAQVSLLAVVLSVVRSLALEKRDHYADISMYMNQRVPNDRADLNLAWAESMLKEVRAQLVKKVHQVAGDTRKKGLGEKLEQLETLVETKRLEEALNRFLRLKKVTEENACSQEAINIVKNVAGAVKAQKKISDFYYNMERRIDQVIEYYQSLTAECKLCLEVKAAHQLKLSAPTKKLVSQMHDWWHEGLDRGECNSWDNYNYYVKPESLEGVWNRAVARQLVAGVCGDNQPDANELDQLGDQSSWRLVFVQHNLIDPCQQYVDKLGNVFDELKAPKGLKPSTKTYDKLGDERKQASELWSMWAQLKQCQHVLKLGAQKVLDLSGGIPDLRDDFPEKQLFAELAKAHEKLDSGCLTGVFSNFLIWHKASDRSLPKASKALEVYNEFIKEDSIKSNWSPKVARGLVLQASVGAPESLKTNPNWRQVVVERQLISGCQEYVAETKSVFEQAEQLGFKPSTRPGFIDSDEVRDFYGYWAQFKQCQHTLSLGAEQIVKEAGELTDADDQEFKANQQAKDDEDMKFGSAFERLERLKSERIDDGKEDEDKDDGDGDDDDDDDCVERYRRYKKENKQRKMYDYDSDSSFDSVASSTDS